MIPSPLYFSCYWNLDGEWNPTAPEGMRIFGEKFREFENDSRENQYTWYGKMSFTTLGIPPEIGELNKVIQKQNNDGIETRLYLYTFYEFNGMKVPYSLHVAKVMELRGQDVYDEDKAHIPTNFYDSMKDRHEILRERWKPETAIPFFFKITDIRELSISDAEKLQKATEKSKLEFEQFRWHDTTSPAYVREKPPFPNWFDGKTPWWKEVLKSGDDLDPGKFRTSAVKEVYYQALQYAALNRPILIVGERGTGKTHLARFIRRNSRYCKEKYSGNWRPISCAEYIDPNDLEKAIFGNEGSSWNRESLSGETLVLDDIEHMPKFLIRKVLNRFEQEARRETGQTTKTFRLIACTSLPPYELHDRLDPRFLDSTVILPELPPIKNFEPEDRVTCWDHQYEQVKRQIFPNETIPSMTTDEREDFIKNLHVHPLVGNFRDLKRLATRTLLELKFKETISDREKRTGLRAAEIFEEVLRRPQTYFGTDKEKAKALAWCFLSNHRLETGFDIPNKIDGLKELIDNLTIKVKSYMAENVDRLAKSRNRNAKKIKEESPASISRWRNEVQSSKKSTRLSDD
jgi:transcriptional regulator with AAA-type ATPase domain